MTKKSYTDLLKDPRWQKKRLQIMSRDKFTCKLCKDTETELQVHHKKYINGNAPWEYEDKQLITLCKHCHEEITSISEEVEIPFDKIVISKFNRWAGGSRIMFVSYNGDCIMRIYDNDDGFIAGYALGRIIPDIINILKNSLNVKTLH